MAEAVATCLGFALFFACIMWSEERAAHRVYKQLWRREIDYADRLQKHVQHLENVIDSLEDSDV